MIVIPFFNIPYCSAKAIFCRAGHCLRLIYPPTEWQSTSNETRLRWSGRSDTDVMTLACLQALAWPLRVEWQHLSCWAWFLPGFSFRTTSRPDVEWLRFYFYFFILSWLLDLKSICESSSLPNLKLAYKKSFKYFFTSKF